MLTTPSIQEQERRRDQRRPGPAARAAWRIAAAGVSGVVLYWSFPPRTLWFLAPLAVAGLYLALRHCSIRLGGVIGLVFGAGFLLPLLVWTGTYVGPGPWLALVLLQSMFFAATGALVAALSRLPGAALWTAAAWVAGEAARTRVPFGGFGWGRAAFGQADGPLLPVAALGGAPLLSFAVVLTGAATAAALVGVVRRLRATHQLGHPDLRVGPRSPEGWAAVVGVAVVLALTASPLALPRPLGVSEELTVAVVQGNVPRLGLDFNTQRRAVLDNHLNQTRRLAADVRAGRTPRPDLVIWPENSSDLDPVHDPAVAREISEVVDAVGAPTVIGAVVRVPGEPGPRNTALLWQPGAGLVDSYAKRRLQPFGETMPLRDLLRTFTPLVDRAGNFVPGSDASPLISTVAPIGVATCYEIAFDDTVRDTISAGAQLLAVPSNNATFGLTEMTYQQLAMSRVRAVEHDRAVLVAATSGVSAVIAPDGAVLARSGQFEPAVLVARVRLSTTTTQATRIGPLIEATIVAAALGGAGVVGVRHRRNQRDPGI
ncbi:apolipoprotein N-acyltransferase [Pseudonocardia sp. KRD291]|uniref:apolipoprotein N-acyltransferase n=1 Tax=Pseudonocardia sp. KRD291 TaxID=2792007 RepID=UPI001C4A4553|nr:apolipoprotein N-acyltransferase [Pseudonocardia sp. KRD291]